MRTSIVLKRLKTFFRRLFYPIPPANKGPKFRLGDMDGNIKLEKQWQLDKRTDFKVGDSYRVGEMVVTLRSSKAEVQAIIAALDAKRAKREEKQRERAIELMLMSPEELDKLALGEWLSKRGVEEATLKELMGDTYEKRMLEPKELPEDGRKDTRVKNRFHKAMEDWGLVKVKEKVLK